MVRLCATAGVALALLPEIKKAPWSGAAEWLTSDKAMILLNLRGKSEDRFWFTFFHEAKHVLQKRKKDIFLEGVNAETEDGQREEEANVFSRHWLIPEAEWGRFLSDEAKKESAAIKAFASRIKIHPGIVVGRIMREKLLPYSHPARRLITKFVWA